jgi:hypothetical protein
LNTFIIRGSLFCFVLFNHDHYLLFIIHWEPIHYALFEFIELIIPVCIHSSFRCLVMQYLPTAQGLTYRGGGGRGDEEGEWKKLAGGGKGTDIYNI